MTQILKQSTAVDVLIGPFLDATNGYDAESGLSPSVKLSKNGQTLAAKNDATTPTHDADGYYNCELDATDTNTVGTLVLTVAGSATALPVRHEFQVVEEATFDFLYASGATPIADINAECDTALSDYDALVPGDLPANFADLAITASTGRVTVGTNNDKTGYSISGTKTTLDALNDVSAADVNAQCDTALTDYDAATGTELAALNNLSTGDISAACDAALASYDGPTKTEFDAAIAALNNLSSAEATTACLAALTTQMTESYAANGVAPTAVQALFAIHQMLMQFAISGTTIGVKKLDNSTSAFDVTLDDATTPTSAARV